MGLHRPPQTLLSQPHAIWRPASSAAALPSSAALAGTYLWRRPAALGSSHAERGQGINAELPSLQCTGVENGKMGRVSIAQCLLWGGPGLTRLLGQKGRCRAPQRRCRPDSRCFSAAPGGRWAVHGGLPHHMMMVPGSIMDSLMSL